MTTVEKEKLPARGGSALAKNTPAKGVSSSKDEAVSAARRLGPEVVSIQVKRLTGSVRTIIAFEIPALEAADLIENAKLPSFPDRENLEPTAKVVAAMNGPYVGPFKTKRELFDALDAKEGS